MSRVFISEGQYFQLYPSRFAHKHLEVRNLNILLLCHFAKAPAPPSNPLA